jgi:hypothetical protein
MKKVILVIIALLCVSEIFAEGAKYLIITHDNFYDAIQPLAQWKHKKGIPTKVVRLSEIGAAPESIARIKNYIVNAYNTWNPRPEYILLIGSPNYIRCYQGGDDYYGDMSGNYLMELSVGRFSITNPSQCSVVVAKTLGYERIPFLDDTSWFKKGTAIVRESNDPTIDSLYWNSTRYCAELMRSTGFVHIDTFSASRGDSARHIEQAITDGRTYVVYQGLGIVNWWAPLSIDTARINNGFKLPVIVSASDITINLFTAEGYLGENLIRAGSFINPKGAVGYFGTTVAASGPGLEVQRVTVGRGFFRTIFLDRVYKLGDVTKRAKYILDSIQLPYYTATRYREWNLLGDPELNLWTAVPKPLTVIYDSIIHPTPCSVTVSVMSNGFPFPNALVCLMKDTTIYEYGNTNSNGVKVFPISPQDTGTISITVTACNRHPFEGTIRILPEGIEERSTLDATGNMLEVYPNPAKVFFTLRLPQSTGREQIKIYDITGKVVKEARSERHETRISLDGIKNGVYFVRVRDVLEIKKLVITK